MYCLVANYQTNDKNLNEVIKLFQNQAIPMVAKQPGFKGVYFLTKTTGELMLLNIWDTEQQATAWAQDSEQQKISDRPK